MNLPRKLDRVTLESVMCTLKKYNLARQLDRLNDATARIEVYPSVMLAEYQPILQYMLQHDCKIEQECFEAMRLEQLVGYSSLLKDEIEPIEGGYAPFQR